MRRFRAAVPAGGQRARSLSPLTPTFFEPTTTVASGMALRSIAGQASLGPVTETGAAMLMLPSPTETHALWLRLHASQTWAQLEAALEPLMRSEQVINWTLTSVDGDPSPPGLKTLPDHLPSPRAVSRTEAKTGWTYVLPLIADDRIQGTLSVTVTAEFQPDWTYWGDLAAHLGQAARNVGALEALHARTNRDETTGLFNARHLTTCLELELSRSRRFGHALAVLFIDLDHFKAVNDRFGHLAGTALLVEIADRLVQTIRSVDAAFRYGGDEFVLVLVETSREAAKCAAHRIRQRLREQSFVTADGTPVPISVSIGVAAHPEDGDTVRALLNAADQALYQAKASGRNDVVSTGDLATTPHLQGPSTGSTS